MKTLSGTRTFAGASRRRFIALAAAVPFACGRRRAAAGGTPDNVEALVQLLEQTSRARVIENLVDRIRAGLAPEQLIAALLMAGSRGIAARPHVGYQYHAIMGLQSVWLAAESQTGADRWLPLLWAADYYKAAAARDRNRGDWALPPIDDSRFPRPEHAHAALVESLNNWDVTGADAAISVLAHTASTGPVFDVLFRFSLRDFRDIGHKVIAVANCHRLLAVSTHEARAPALRSLIWALLNHHGEHDPISSATPTARAWRNSQQPMPVLGPIPESVIGRAQNTNVTVPQVLASLRTTDPETSNDSFRKFWDSGVSGALLCEGLLLSAAELMLQRRNFIALHAMTMTEAVAYGHMVSNDSATRRVLLCQGAAQLAAFRAFLKLDQDDPALRIETIEAAGSGANAEAIFALQSDDRLAAAQQILSYRLKGGSTASLIALARRYAIAKTTEIHDYKFTEAVVAGYTYLSRPWRDRWLATGACWFNTPDDPDNPVTAHARSALGGI